MFLSLSDMASKLGCNLANAVSVRENRNIDFDLHILALIAANL